MVEITSVAIAVTISAIITAALYFYKEKKIEPKRWKKNAKKDSMEKRLFAYGSLVNFLQEAEKRGKNFIKADSPNKKYLLLFPGDETEFHKIFQGNHYLFSPATRDQYLEILQNDDDLMFSKKKWKKDQSSWYEVFDFSDLHQLAEDEYNDIKIDYEELIGYKLD